MDIFQRIEQSLEEMHHRIHELSQTIKQLQSKESLSFNIQEKMILRTEQVRIRQQIEELQASVIKRQKQLQTLAKQQNAS